MFKKILIGVFFLSLFSSAAVAQSYSSRISSYALALPKDNVTLRSNIDSHVKRVLVKEGQFVQKGDLLVELNCEAAIAKKEIAKLAAEELGEKMNAKAELKYAKSNWKKFEDLHRRKAVNAKELEEARLRLERAKAQLRMAMETHASNQAKLALADAELKDHFLRAPFDGQIVDLKVSPGSAITSDTDILQIISSNDLRADLYLPLDESADLKVGDTYSLVVQEPFKGQHVTGTVLFCSPIIEATSGARRVTLEIDNRELRLPAGFTVSMSQQ